MKHSVIILAVGLAVTLSSGALVYKDLGFYYYEDIGIILAEGRTLTISEDCDTVQPPVSTHCVRYNCDSSDCFFKHIGFWDGNGCGGDVIAVTSYDTIARLKDPSLIYRSELPVLSDTTAFRYDNYFGTGLPECTEWCAICPDFQDPCPYDGFWSTPEPVWYIGRTRTGNYFIFRFTGKELRQTGVDSVTSSKKYHDYITITCFIQTNGSPDFSEVEITAANSRKPGRQQQVPQSIYSVSFGMPFVYREAFKLYDLRGRLVKAPAAGTRRINRPSLTIVERANRYHTHYSGK